MNDDVTDIVRTRINDYAQNNRQTKFSKRGVRKCVEFERIDALPRREWSDVESNRLVTQLTAILRQPAGQQTLRHVQAIALYEIAQVGGLLGPIGVGEGKTLITLLAPVILAAKRPLLVLPAKLIEKTKRERIQLMGHWRIHPNITIVSFEWLSIAKQKFYLEETLPDCIVLDEAHRIRSKKAARTKVVIRYCDKHNVPMIALSGTLVHKRVNDWAHISQMALGDRSPAPRKWNTIAHWGAALDHDASIPPGVLSAWCERDETVREAYQRRVIQTPGVVCTSQGLVGVALNAFKWAIDIPFELEQALYTLAEYWTLPDGYSITDPLEYYRKARQLALGVYYRWKEQPPEQWRGARLMWSRMVRHCIRYVRANGVPLDSELQVANAVDAGHVDQSRVWAAIVRQYDECPEVPGGLILDWWRQWRPLFKPDTEHVWVTDSIIKAAIRFAKQEPTLVWVEAESGGVAVGNKLHELGLPYYGSGQRTPDGTHVLDANPKDSMALSIKACGEGLNLQPWARTMVLAPVQNANDWEQFLGRNHRPGQDADEIDVHIAQLAAHHEQSWERALWHAKFLRESTGQQQKLLQMTLANMPMPEGWEG